MLSWLTGIPAQEQVLHVGGKRLPDSISLTAARICDGDLLTLTGRLRGGAPTLTLTIKPRVQKDKWSLYWKVGCLSIPLTTALLCLQMQKSLSRCTYVCADISLTGVYGDQDRATVGGDCEDKPIGNCG